MKTNTINTFFNSLGVATNIVNGQKGVIELPYVNGMMVAVSDNTGSQVEATSRFREISSSSQTVLMSAVDLRHPGGSTIVPGVDVRVPVFSVYAGRMEDVYKTNGHQITSNRLMAVMRELDELSSGKAKPKTPYLSWLCKSLGITRPRSLKALQDIIIEAAQHPEAASIPAIHQLLVGRGTRHAVLTVNPQVEYQDTEPVVNESDWMLCDLERLVIGGMTDAQASVIRKTALAFEKATEEQAVAPQAQDERGSRERTIEMLVA